MNNKKSINYYFNRIYTNIIKSSGNYDKSRFEIFFIA